MIAEKKKQVQTLLLLVVLLVFAAGYAYWSLRTPSVEGPVTPAEKVARVASLQSATNARIRMDLIEQTPEKSLVGKRNVFQYYVPPPPPKPPAPQPPPPAMNTRPPQTIVTQPPLPPSPQTALNSFKYDGVGIVARPGKMVASISEGTTNRYNVSEGDYILGRYRVNRVTETQVEIEDLDLSRRQTYTRITQ